MAGSMGYIDGDTFRYLIQNLSGGMPSFFQEIVVIAETDDDIIF